MTFLKNIEMKSVGIITKHRIYNYGSFMQAYATQRAIEKMGYEATLIDYQYPNPFHATYPSLKDQIRHWANNVMKNLLPGRLGTSLARKYQDAFDTYYHLTNKYPTQKSIMDNPPNFDIYVVGSDQLWRPAFTNGDGAFFADFAPKGKKKVSYASSFGCLKIEESFKDEYTRMLGAFDELSVREESGISIIKELTGRDAHLVLDPSLLLQADEWRHIKNASGVRGRYVFCYGMIDIDYVNRVAKELIGNEDMAIVRTNGNFFDYFNKDIHYILDCGPLEWLDLIDNADLVLAGSFHGTAFSIQFHKPFLSVLSGEENQDSRQINLLNLLKLQKNLLYVGDENFSSIAPNMYGINWDEVDSVLNRYREDSISYLRNSLS